MISKISKSLHALQTIKKYLPQELSLQFYHGLSSPVRVLDEPNDHPADWQVLKNRSLKLEYNLDIRTSTTVLFTTFVHFE